MAVFDSWEDLRQNWYNRIVYVKSLESDPIKNQSDLKYYNKDKLIMTTNSLASIHKLNKTSLSSNYFSSSEYQKNYEQNLRQV